MTSSKRSSLTDLSKSITTYERTGTMVNVPLLRKTIEHITEHPTEWNQESWGVQTPCGTSHCFAGHAATLSGYEPVWYPSWDGTGAPRLMVAVTRNGYHESPFFVAADLLGLSHDRALDLFSCSNTMRDLWFYVHLFSDGEIEIPPAYR